MGREWTRLVGIQAQHKARIEELEEMESVRVKCKETTTVETATFRRGLVTDCSWFAFPVVWTDASGEQKEEKVEEKYEEVEQQKTLLVLGGYHCDGGESYDVSKNCWTESSISLPNPTYCHAMTVFRGSLFATGGRDKSSKRTLNTALKFDLKTQTWSEAASMMTPRFSHGMAELDGMLYVAGGCTTGLNHLASVERYDPTRNCWEKIAPMSQIRRACVRRSSLRIGGKQR
jgi:hypothetical protein